MVWSSNQNRWLENILGVSCDYPEEQVFIWYSSLIGKWCVARCDPADIQGFGQVLFFGIFSLRERCDHVGSSPQSDGVCMPYFRSLDLRV